MATNSNSIVDIYEASPCGSWLYRHLQKRRINCWVTASALIPRVPEDRVKTDKHDACKLACLARSGDITPIYAPDAKDEAMWDLRAGMPTTQILIVAQRPCLQRPSKLDRWLQTPNSGH